MGLMASIKAQKAYNLHGKGDYEGALRLYEEAVAGGMNNPRFLLPYSTLLLRRGEYAKAREILRQTQKAPGLSGEQHIQLFVNYVACVYRLGEIDKGIALLERQHAKETTGLLYQALGCLYVEKYDLRNTPDFDALEAAEAAAAEEKQIADDQEAPMEDAAAGKPTEPEEVNHTPREAWQQGIDRAEALIRESIEYDDEDAVCLDNMGQFLYRVKGDREAARPWFERAIQQKDNQIDTLYFLAQYDLEEGKKDDARQKLEKALKGRFSPLNYSDKEKIEAALAQLG